MNVTPRILAVTLILAAVLAGAPGTAQQTDLPLLDHRTESWFLPFGPGATGGPAAGLFNPAAFALSDRAGADFWWNDRNVRSGLDNYGFAAGRSLHFAMQSTTWGVAGDSWKTYDYQLGLAGGDRRATAGLAYRWSHGETSRTPRQKAFVLGLVSRPDTRVSVGAAAAWSLESGAAQYVFDMGLRPLGREWLTVCADWTVDNDQAFFRDGGWSAGLEVRPLRGVHLGVRAREPLGGGDPTWTGVLGLTVDAFNLTALPAWNADGDHTQTAWLVRSTTAYGGQPTREGLVFRRPTRYFALDLQNKTLSYQKYRYFDEKRVAWLDLLRVLETVREDPGFDGLALNIAGLESRPSLMWELRREIELIRAAGKEVIVHGDRMGPLHCYVAAAADVVTVDPWGMVALPGFALSRSYLAGTLEKLGLGFQEFRYFTYKSAAEALSRDSMSEADREQRQRMVDVMYETVGTGIADGRGLTTAAVDAVVDEEAILLPDEAVAAGIVDGIARWDGLGRWLREHRNARLVSDLPEAAGREYWDEQWGKPVVIPVVYAVGPCAMDSGIKGRATSEYLRRLKRDPSVAAVVLRADSPGGDALPSDLVADAVRQLKAAGKPVIVSQGDVAASGGYWISMDGTRILTTPLTVTGSIGVIGGWIWDDGFADKLGMTSDAVSRGAHADLFTTVRIPFLGGIPRRAMTADEEARVKEGILDNYDRFVAAVARGRGLDEAAVREVAEGRVWMGGDAVARNLCDGYGTLAEAIAAARDAAGVPPWREVRVTEFPPRPLFELPQFLPQLPRIFGLGDAVNRWLVAAAGSAEAAAAATDETLGPVAPGLHDLDLEYLRAVAAAEGRPLVMVPPDVLPDAWRRLD